MKATTNSAFSPFTGLVLKLVGWIMILSSIVDYIVLLIPPNRPGNVEAPQWVPLLLQWQQNTTTQLVDRGIIPMVGLALLFLGYWISSNTDSDSSRKSWQDPRFWALVLSSLLGLIFLIAVPFHLNNVRQISNQALQQIDQRADQVENQIKAESQQVSALLTDQQKLNELDRVISSGQVQGEQLTRLQAIKQQIESLKQNPKALNTRIAEAQNQVRSRKLEEEKRTKGEAWKSGARTGISSLLLAIGYIVIGWTGLRSLLSSGMRRQPQVR